MEFIIGAVLGLLVFTILGLIVLGFSEDNGEYLFCSVVLCTLVLIIAGIINGVDSNNALVEKCISTGHKVIKIEENSYCKL